VPRLHVLAVSARLPDWAEAACAEYAKRMPKGYEVQRVDLKREDQVRAAVPKGARMIALDERGREYSTEKFATLLQAPSAFVIGGADGLSAETKSQADMMVRLSAMTLPHAIAQVLLLEQMYRGATLLTGHPYHRK
jgi:23S rRNA (pseudouridine1915-N3)-methyltransferase